MAPLDSTLQFILADFQARDLPELVGRELRLPSLARKADVLVGMRRAGKTYALFDQMRRLLARGIAKRRILYLNLEDDRLGAPDAATLDRAVELFYRASPEARADTAYLFFDELQVVDGWERVLRRLLDTERARVFVTGSSAKLLSTEVATQFRGRGVAVEVLPFGLREAAQAHGVDAGRRWPPPASVRSALAAFVDAYLMRGGFPEVQHANAFDRTQLLQDYVELVLLRDVVERHAVENIVAARYLVRAIFAANAGLLSVSKLHRSLASQGIRVSKATLLAYLDHLTDAYVAFAVPLRARSEKQRLVNPRKIYAVDSGLASAMHLAGAQNTGALLENLVYLELRRELGRLSERNIGYYRTASGNEVDFVVDPVDAAGRPRLVQACASLGEPVTRAREVRALEEAMRETGTQDATIVTLADRDVVATAAGTIRIVPAWEWFFAPREMRERHLPTR